MQDGKKQVNEEPETPIEEQFGDLNCIDSGDEFKNVPVSLCDIHELEAALGEPNFRDSTYIGELETASRNMFLSQAEKCYYNQKESLTGLATYNFFSPIVYRSLGNPDGRLEPDLRHGSDIPQDALAQPEKEMELEELKKAQASGKAEGGSEPLYTHRSTSPQNALAHLEIKKITELHSKPKAGPKLTRTQSLRLGALKKAEAELFGKPESYLKDGLKLTRTQSLRPGSKTRSRPEHVLKQQEEQEMELEESEKAQAGALRKPEGRFELTRTQELKKGEAELLGKPKDGLKLTRTQSLKLGSKLHLRPKHVLAQQKEEEEMELEESEKAQAEALCKPEGGFELTRTQSLRLRSKKPNTIPEPFKLTEIQKKLPVIKTQDYIKFKARPVPRHILEKPQIPVKPTLPITIPISQFHKKTTNSQDVLKNNVGQQAPVKKPQRQGPIRPEPFSFDKYDEERKKRKEERIRKQIEDGEERIRKQASSFKANPLTGVFKKLKACVTAKGPSTTSSENK